MRAAVRHPQPEPESRPETAESREVPTLVVPVRATVTVLAVLAGLIALVGISAQYLWMDADAGGAGGLISKLVAGTFTLDGEGNVPAWFQSALLLLSAGLCWIASGADRPRALHATGWRVLAAAFVVFSCDEISSGHETLGYWLAPRTWPAMGVYAWLLAGVPFVAIVGFALRGLLRDLPRATRRGLLIAGGLYLAGAVGVEVVEAIIDARTYGTFTFEWVAAIEETLEMAGLVWLVGTLLVHLRRSPPVRLAERG